MKLYRQARSDQLSCDTFFLKKWTLYDFKKQRTLYVIFICQMPLLNYTLAIHRLNLSNFKKLKNFSHFFFAWPHPNCLNSGEFLLFNFLLPKQHSLSLAHTKQEHDQHASRNFEINLLMACTTYVPPCQTSLLRKIDNWIICRDYITCFPLFWG